MQLPPHFPSLGTPNFILAPPIKAQRFIISLISIFTLGFWGLAYYSVFLYQIPWWALTILITNCIFFTILLFSPSIRYRWVTFAADRSGCYFRAQRSVFGGFKLNTRDAFVFVPWRQVGEITIVSDSDNAKALSIPINVDDESWKRDFSTEEFLPSFFSFLKVNKNLRGEREVLLANQFLNLDSSLKELNRLRP